ncbi:glycosyltransferase family 9 protein [bacterium]|nr:glycosyltransferase family 9 protein [bacterium]
MKINNDCIYFKGDMPCKPHKDKGYHCHACPEYAPYDHQILIIKLGSGGDVVRTSPVLHQIRKSFPQAHIIWITKTVDLVPQSHVNTILNWNTDNILWLKSLKFDIVYSLDKDKQAIALATSLQTTHLKGYTMDEWGHCQAVDKDACHKWQIGLWDDLYKENPNSYSQEIVELCGFTYNKDEYIINPPNPTYRYGIDATMKIVGLNPGSSKDYATKLWGEDNWIQLCKALNKSGFTPVIFGNEYDNEMNMRISSRGRALYFGVKPIKELVSLINCCELVVTNVTMAMHIAIALKKKVVILNNIYNKNEFELYGLGTILEPDKPCKCCYLNSCDEPCLETIPVENVYNEITDLIGLPE